MFDIGWSELLVVGVVALVVIGPKDLPGALRSLGKAIATMRKMASGFQDQFNEAMKEAELDELRREVAELKRTTSEIFQQADVSTHATNEIRSAIEQNGPIMGPLSSTVETGGSSDAQTSHPIDEPGTPISPDVSADPRPPQNAQAGPAIEDVPGRERHP